ncbi:hypothetical protein J1605_010276 [Eschrichtius robustus]|uniref:Uncharacterized protein n=1 Tax=Eschrichtius robustus TaxID=9764 RepID=A0AB34GP24_ESCRO|nr:hypothetical protein J1605_010276 [Eschrichtius robustus]
MLSEKAKGVEWIQQQVVKKRTKRDYDFSHAQSTYFNDPKWPSMWYMTSNFRVPGPRTSWHQNHLEGLLPTPLTPPSGDLGICISNKFPVQLMLFDSQDCFEISVLYHIFNWRFM